eukprot:2645176-Amphidinium_carterae.1
MEFSKGLTSTNLVPSRGNNAALLISTACDHKAAYHVTPQVDTKRFHKSHQTTITTERLAGAIPFPWARKVLRRTSA